MTDPEAKLAELEAREKEIARLLEIYKNQYREERDKALESVKALESEMREKNEQVLQLAKDAEFGKKFRELLVTANPPSASTGTTGTVRLTDVKWQVEVKEEVRKVEAAETTTCRGRLLKLGKDGFFDKRRTFGDIMAEFPRRGWPDSDKTVSNTLLALFNDALIAKDKPGEGKAWEYFRPESVSYA